MGNIMSSFRRISPVVAALTVSASLVACSPTQEESKEDVIKIVASTQVWADVVDAITDDSKVQIEAIVKGTDTDPHSFEPTAMDMAKASEADIIVVGGGGYDSWLYSKVDEKKVVHALELSEHDHDHEHGSHDAHEEHEAPEGHDAHEEHGAHEGQYAHAGHDHGPVAEGAEENEHIWYNTSALTQVAEDTAKAIKEINPDVKVDAAAAESKIDALDKRIHALPEAKVAQTHPIADHILLHTHMSDITPAGYRATTLSESEPAAADVDAFLKLIEADEVQLLVDTPQTSTPYSKRIREAAEAKQIPVVEVSETPTTGTNFFDFFAATIDSFEKTTAHIGHAH